jgi:oxygen-independent coproporphyrinogen-3 oxidase
MKKLKIEDKDSKVYDLRENWPPYTYRDYPDIKQETYKSFMEFLSTENKSDKVLELQPWISLCASRCTFCYYPTSAFSPSIIQPYLGALKKELEMYAKTTYIQTSKFDEIVLGGGTPSVLSAEQMIDLISFCEKNFTTTDEYFIKVTCSSKTLETAKLQKLAKYGVYQVDMGAQTFDDKLRKQLRLPDSAKNVERAVTTARKLGMCVCIDLMYNIPGQTMESWIDTLKKAIELDAEIDCYSLNVYPDTVLGKQLKAGEVPAQGDAEFEKQMYLRAYEMLTDAGYGALGHDRFSRVEWHYKENCLNGWPWAGILTTGFGCIMGYLQKFSYTNVEDVNKYIEIVNSGKLPIDRLSESTTEDMMRRTMTRLYLRLPVDKIEFFEKFGKYPEDVFSKELTALIEKKLIEIDDKEIRITQLGDLWKGNIAWEFAPKKNGQ